MQPANLVFNWARQSRQLVESLVADDGEIALDLDYGLIRAIHSLLRQQTDLKYRLEQVPRKLKLAQSNEAQFLATLEAAKLEQRRLHMSVDEKQLQLNEREARVEQLKFRMNTCDSNKEFQLIKDCIAADTQANSVLQDEIFELLERLDAQKLLCETSKVNYEKAQADRQRVSQNVQEEQLHLESDLSRVTTRLAEEEAKLRGDVLKEYRHGLKGMGENIFGETDGQTCGNCFQNLTIQKSAELQMSRAVYCPNCSCLLYLAARTSPTADS